MIRYISEDKVKDAIVNALEHREDVSDDAIDEALKDIGEILTVDAVEVVRCKDCKKYMTIHCTCDGCCISDEWYCADGEPKEQEHET